MSEGVIKAGVCLLCHDGKGKYLVAKRAANLERDPNTWSPVAGTVEFNEPVEETVIRELKEEVDAQAQELEFLGFRNFLNSRNEHLIMFDYRVLVNPSDIKNNEPDKCDVLEWFSIKEISKLDGAHPQFSRVLEMYKDKLI